MDGDWIERRKHPRMQVPARAVLLCDGVEIGQYAVDNLSPGGALLTGEVAPSRGELLQILLEVDGRSAPIEVDAMVVRNSRRDSSDDSIAVRFEHWSSATEDAIREALYGAPGTRPEIRMPELCYDEDFIEIVPPPR